MIKTLFSKMERFLIRNNKRFVINTDSSDGDSSSDSKTGDYMLEGINGHQDQRFSLLLEETGIPFAFDDEPPDDSSQRDIQVQAKVKSNLSTDFSFKENPFR